jgi:hypothetical protein
MNGGFAMRKILLWVLAFIVLTAACVALAATYRYWQSWLAYETGSANSSSVVPNYNYWSGFGSVFPWSMDTAVALWIIAWHHIKARNCHVHGCLRIGSLPVGDPPYLVCKKHHWEVTGAKIDVQHLKVIHHLHKRKRLLDAGYTTKAED